MAPWYNGWHTGLKVRKSLDRILLTAIVCHQIQSVYKLLWKNSIELCSHVTCAFVLMFTSKINVVLMVLQTEIHRTSLDQVSVFAFASPSDFWGNVKDVLFALWETTADELLSLPIHYWFIIFWNIAQIRSTFTSVGTFDPCLITVEYIRCFNYLCWTIQQPYFFKRQPVN